MVPISQSLIKSAQQAHSKYLEQLDERKRQTLEVKQLNEEQEAAEKKKQIEKYGNTIADLERQLADKRKAHTSTSSKLIKYAHDRLKQGIANSTNSNFDQVQIGQGMLEGASNLKQKYEKEQEMEITKLKRSTEKRKSTLIDMISKKATLTSDVIIL